MSEIDSDSSEELNEQEENEQSDELEDVKDEENQEEGSDFDDDDEEEDDKEEVRMPVINPISFIKNKERRRALFKKLQAEKKKKRRTERKDRKKSGKSGNGGHTIESLREPDQTTITNIDDEANAELQKELELDEFSSYYQGGYEPRLLITFSDNPATKTRKFGLELARVFPNALVKVRNRSSVKRMVKSATREGFTDILIINENRRQPNGLLVIHLPDGPTAHFKVSNVKLTKDLRRDHKEINRHRPELILTNFTTRLGLTIGRMFGALFHHDPEFRGRRVATFHNQRDYIFFRHHRYEFDKDGKRAKLRELGPRFTLKLRSLQEGTFDSKYGDYIWIMSNKRHAMEGRRRFFL